MNAFVPALALLIASTLPVFAAPTPAQAQAAPADASGVAGLTGAMRFVMAELRDHTGRLHAVTNPIFVA